MASQALAARLAKHSGNAFVAELRDPLMRAHAEALRDSESAAFRDALKALCPLFEKMPSSGGGSASSTTLPQGILEAAELKSVILPALRIRPNGGAVRRQFGSGGTVMVASTLENMREDALLQCAVASGLYLLQGIDFSRLKYIDAFKVACAADRFMWDHMAIMPQHYHAAAAAILRAFSVPTYSKRLIVEVGTSCELVGQMLLAAGRDGPTAMSADPEYQTHDRMVFRSFQAAAVRIAGMVLAAVKQDKPRDRLLMLVNKAFAENNYPRLFHNVVGVALNSSGIFSEEDRVNATLACLDVCEVVGQQAAKLFVSAGGQKLRKGMPDLGSAEHSALAATRLKACLALGGVRPSARCAVCGNGAPAGQKMKKCGKCQQVRYCGVDCQRQHWRSGHKHECTEQQ